MKREGLRQVDETYNKKKKVIYLANQDVLYIMNFVVLHVAKMWMTRNGINWTEGQTSSILVVS